jgi:hypothetical protein
MASARVLSCAVCTLPTLAGERYVKPPDGDSCHVRCPDIEATCPECGGSLWADGFLRIAGRYWHPGCPEGESS